MQFLICTWSANHWQKPWQMSPFSCTAHTEVDRHRLSHLRRVRLFSNSLAPRFSKSAVGAVLYELAIKGEEMSCGHIRVIGAVGPSWLQLGNMPDLVNFYLNRNTKIWVYRKIEICFLNVKLVFPTRGTHVIAMMQVLLPHLWSKPHPLHNRRCLASSSDVHPCREPGAWQMLYTLHWCYSPPTAL